ncbi:MAG: hypothetical protein ABH875_07390 [Candidatus Omnitrophota bacterium]
MKAKNLCFGLAAALICVLLAMDASAGTFNPFYIYSNKRADVNHYAPSGWMGDSGAIKFSDGWPKDTYAGPSCVQIKYLASKSTKEKWAGMYWQDPPNNWGDKIGGHDLVGAKKLVFAIRGENGGEVVNDIFVGGIKGKYADSCSIAIGPIELTKEWEVYEVDLEGQDLSNVIGGFGWSTNMASNPNGCTFYIDEIRFE